MASALGRCLVNGVRISNALVLPVSRVRPQTRPWLPLRYCVASTARGYSTSDGTYTCNVTRAREYVILPSSCAGSERRFAKSHEWVKLDGTSATIGISDYAQVI